MAMNMGVPDVVTGKIRTGASGGIGEPMDQQLLGAVEEKVKMAAQKFQMYLDLPEEQQENDHGLHAEIKAHLNDALAAIAAHKAQQSTEQRTNAQNKGMNSALRAATGRR